MSKKRPTRKHTAKEELQSNLPDPEEAERLAAEATGQEEESRGRGRPPATHGRVRFTTIIDPAKRDEMKLIALKDHKTISDVFEEAVTDYIRRWKAENKKE